MPTKKRTQFRPNADALCLCGSGEAFSACCADQLPGFTRGERMRAAWRKGDWTEALIAARAEFSQYTIWHKTNTEPAVRQGNPAIEQLLAVDIAAMGELVGELCALHHRLDRQGELPAVLERIRTNVNDPRWHRKLTYYQALVADLSGDHRAAQAEFAKLGPITADEKDVEIVQAYLDLFGDKLSFARKIELCDQIIKISSNVGDHLQYGGLKGLTYAAVGDFEQARKSIAYAVAYGRMEAKREALSLRARNFMAGNLTMLALFSRDEKYFKAAKKAFASLLAEPDAWTDEGRASLHDQLGECYRYWGKWSDAEAEYRASLAICANGISSVFLAECLLRQGRTDEAAQTLDAIDVSVLGGNEKVDYAYIVASIAVESADRNRLSSALTVLQSVTASAPHFEERRLKFIIDVQTAIAEGPARGTWRKLSKFLKEPLRTLSRYAVLQPNVLGIGLNINALIDDTTKQKGGGEKSN